jgi:hypothetical protein
MVLYQCNLARVKADKFAIATSADFPSDLSELYFFPFQPVNYIEATDVSRKQGLDESSCRDF